MLLDAVNHIAWLSKDVARLGRFTPTCSAPRSVLLVCTDRSEPGETMTVIRIGPQTELNIFVIEGNTEADRPVPMWGRSHRPRRAAGNIDRGVREDPRAIGQDRCRRRHRHGRRRP